MSKLVTIYGGSGFLGRYIARRLAKDGWRIRVAVRRPNEALFVKPYGAVGQVEPVFCNIRDDDSVRQAMAGADAVINCVAVLSESGKQTFQALHVEGAERIARLAAEEGVAALTHISAIGADPESDSDYARTKGEGEAAVLAAFPGAVILRPSVMFGPEDQFYNRFAGMTRMGPTLPLVGANTKFQPVYVDDVALAATMAVEGKAAPGVYELGGPEVRTFRELMAEMLGVIQRRRLIVNMPFWVASIMGWVIGFLSSITGGLMPALLTRDQVRNLRRDNVVAEDAQGFEAFGIKPVAPETILPEYLWRFRPGGQYAELTKSAKYLKNG